MEKLLTPNCKYAAWTLCDRANEMDIDFPKYSYPDTLITNGTKIIIKLILSANIVTYCQVY